jgi:outer membrane protein TolC
MKITTYILLLINFGIYAQIETLGLQDVINIAITKSPDYQKVKTMKENAYWEWRIYKSMSKPILSLNGTLPKYTNNSIPIYDGDGSIKYRKVDQAESNINLNIEQAIPWTGAKVYVSSTINRFDNFRDDNSNYSGSPIYVGIEQDLFGFNQYKWLDKIEPLKYDEQLKGYIENIEQIAVTTTNLYFNLLLAQIKMQISENNHKISTNLYNLGKEKFKLGRISKNELLQLKFSVISANKNLSQARLNKENSLLSLKSYLGVDVNLSLKIPNKIQNVNVDEGRALELAVVNNSQMVNFKKKLLEAERDEDKAKSETGINAKLKFSFGTTSISDDFGNLYNNSGQMQTVNFSINIPILDWGRKEAKLKKAQANKNLVEYTIEQKEINFKQQVITEVRNFKMYKEYIEFSREADETATERFDIAQKRYLVSDINITELNISQQEKDRAKQDYINSLKSYWLTYFNLRAMCLYDFVENRSLIGKTELEKK